MPEIIAHRGTPRELPENTLDGFARALAQGADGVELDVHATADGAVVVHHDPIVTLDDGSVHPLRSLTLARLRERERERAPGRRVPLLAEALALLAGRARAYVEVKASGIEGLVAACVSTSAADCAVHAFDHRVARHMRQLLPGVPVGILLASYLLDVEGALRLAGATDLWQLAEQVDRPLVEAARAAGARVIAWTVNDADEARRLAALGVAALCTDVPAALRAALAAR